MQVPRLLFVKYHGYQHAPHLPPLLHALRTFPSLIDAIRFQYLRSLWYFFCYVRYFTDPSEACMTSNITAFYFSF